MDTSLSADKFSSHVPWKIIQQSHKTEIYRWGRLFHQARDHNIPLRHEDGDWQK